MSDQDRKTSITVVANNETKSTFQEIKSDAASMAAAVGAAGEQAAKGVREIGNGAEASEAKVARAQGRITSELIRVTEQARIAAEAGGSLSKAFEIKAEMRGLDASALAPVIANLRQYESSLSVSKAKEAELAAQNAFAVKAAQAQQLSKASEYARWWTAELEKAELAEQKLAAQNSFIGSLKSQSDAIGKTRADLLEMKAAQLGMTTQAAPFIAKLREADTHIGKVGMSARATAAAMAQVPLQFQDVIVSLQGGQAPLTVLLQQGSQMAGTFGGAGAAAKAMSVYVLGLVTPLTVAAAAVALLGFAYYKGSQENDSYRKSLLLSGNQVGTSIDQLNQMARAMVGVVGTQSAAASGLAEMTQYSKVGSDKLQEYTTSAILWGKSTGQAVTETAKQFAELAKDPLKASLALNEQMNHLTASVYDQIKALDEQGRTDEAAAVAQQAYSDAMSSRRAEMVQNLGYIERAWNAVGNVAKRAWDLMMGIGRQDTTVDQVSKHIDSLQEKLSLKLAQGPNANGLLDEAYNKGVANLKKQIADAKGFLSLATSADAYTSQAGVNNKQYVDSMSSYDQLSDQFASKETKRTQALTVERNKYNAAVEATKKSYAGAPELAGKLADLEAKHNLNVEGINKRYTEKPKAGSGKAARDDLSIDINATKRDLEVLTFSYTSAQKIMEAQRAAGLVDDKAFYEEKRKYINLEADAQDKLLQAEMDRYKQEKVTKDNRLQVEKGVADTQAKMDKAKMERSTALKVLGYQETGALNAQEASINSAKQAAEDYLFTLQKGFDRNVEAVGWGSERKNIEAGKQQIEDKYTQQRRDLMNQRAQIEMQTGLELNAQQQELYDKRLAIIDNYEALALQKYDVGVARRLEAEGQWLKGVDRAWQDYQYTASNVAQMSADVFTNAVRGMEDSLVTFVTTGKLSFTSLANSAVADITRIIIKQQISNALGVGGAGGGSGGLMGLIGTGLGMLTGSAAGAQTGAGTMSALQDLGVFAKGDVFANSASLSAYSNQVHDTPKFFAFAQGAGVFGEAGPEAIMPLTRAPDGNLGVRALAGGGQGGSTNINVTVQMPQGGSRETALQFGRTVGRQIAVAQSRNG